MTDSDADKQKNTVDPQPSNKPLKKPDDAAGVSVQMHVKIHDPESGEILVSKRA